jgi:predicted DNA-binding transcriptional regulator AlpA
MPANSDETPVASEGDAELRMLDVREVSRFLKLSASQTRTLLRAGELPSIRFKIGSRSKWLVPAARLRELIALKSKRLPGAEIGGGVPGVGRAAPARAIHPPREG